MAKQIVDRHFDYREMAKRSLGAAWNNLSNAQRDEFVRLFAELLEASYADKIERYAKHVGSITPARAWMVATPRCAPWWCVPTTGSP